MRLLFSLIALLLVAGVMVWWSTKDIERTLAPVTGEGIEENGATSGTGMAPIDAAKNAKGLIESGMGATASFE